MNCSTAKSSTRCARPRSPSKVGGATVQFNIISLALSVQNFHAVFGYWTDHMRARSMACNRFRRHRVRCFYGTGGESWRDGSLLESSSLRRCG
jgi:hypothetical protein